jgi:chemotaxis signal transduction protein
VVGSPHGEAAAARRYVILAVCDLRLAIAVGVVERVVHAVAMAPDSTLEAPLAGWVNLHGEHVAALDMRRRLGLAERELQLSDRLVLVRRGALRWFLIVDAVVDVVELAAAALRRRSAGGPVAAAGLAECCAAELTLDDATVPVIDVARLLNAEQLGRLQRAPAGGVGQ